DDWCPLVNFFEDAQAANLWAAEHGLHGTAVPLVEAVGRGKAAWERYLDDHDQQVGPSSPGWRSSGWRR
ncbi:MAG TPA: hypothetical protein VE776_05060, partial [Actinomycetota bacterium]|nr:hypothetical protein [Actinomycetota bacterium]